MNRFTYDLCQEWAEETKGSWIGPDESRERSIFEGQVAAIADRGPDETAVLLDSFHLSEETVAAFRRGEPEKFMRSLFRDALERQLNYCRRPPGRLGG